MLPDQVIDAHHHLWDPADRDYPWMAGLPDLRRTFLESDLLAAVDGTAVGATIVVQATSTNEETEWLLELAAQSSLIVGVVGWVDLTQDGVAERLALLSAEGPLCGIRHQVEDEVDPDWLTRPSVLRGLRAVAEAGLVYDLLIRRSAGAAAVTAAKNLPELTFVVDHLAKPNVASREWDDWRSQLSRLAALPNVSCKLSGLLTEAPLAHWRDRNLERYVLEAVDLFGAERCMFGSDWPVSLLCAGYGDVLAFTDAATATLSEVERLAIFRHAALRLYRLPR